MRNTGIRESGRRERPSSLYTTLGAVGFLSVLSVPAFPGNMFLVKKHLENHEHLGNLKHLETIARPLLCKDGRLSLSLSLSLFLIKMNTGYVFYAF